MSTLGLNELVNEQRIAAGMGGSLFAFQGRFNMDLFTVAIPWLTGRP
jgi:hypothetical protein